MMPNTLHTAQRQRLREVERTLQQMHGALTSKSSALQVLRKHCKESNSLIERIEMTSKPNIGKRVEPARILISRAEISQQIVKALGSKLTPAPILLPSAGPVLPPKPKPPPPRPEPPREPSKSTEFNFS